MGGGATLGTRPSGELLCKHGVCEEAGVTAASDGFPQPRWLVFRALQEAITGWPASFQKRL